MGGVRINPGDRFGNLTAIELVYKTSASGRRRPHWVCHCDCGGEIAVDSGNLRNENTRWCRDCSSAHKSSHRFVHGYSQHVGGRNRAKKEYHAWIGMKRRCLDASDKRYADYGGRGIEVCDEWRKSFVAFLEHMGDAPSKDHQIDRVDNSGNYEPGNCRWATRVENSNNKRNSRHVEIEGETKTLAEWARLSGVSEATIRRRLGLGWAGLRLIEPVASTAQRANGVASPAGNFSSVKAAARAYNKGLTWVYEKINRGEPGWAYLD